jgi:putative transposase
MPFICIYIHFVWTTKHRIPFLESASVRRELWRHIRLNGNEKGIHVDHVGGWIDHCHCLVSLKSTQSLDKIMQLLKGESSHFASHNLLQETGFAWQDGYYAAAVQFERVQQVRRYIQNQKNTMRSKTSQMNMKAC